MTDVQRDVWITCQLSDGGSAAYDLSTALRLTGALDVDVLRESLGILVRRHEALRTTFDPTGDHQLIHPAAEVELRVFDVADLTANQRAERISALLQGELAVMYDLVHGPLFRATLLRSAAHEHTLVLSAHHLISDGTSFGIMQRDLSAIYSAQLRGDRDALEPATPYREYVAWRLDESVASEPYWLRTYEASPVQLDLPVDRQRRSTRAFDYGTQPIDIGRALLTDVRDLAVAMGVTPFTILLAAWEILLYRLSGQQEFANGVYVSGQASMGVRDLVGLCTSLLPLRVTITPEERLTDYLVRLKRSTFDAFDNQHYSVGRLATALRVPRDASRPTVLSTVMTLETPTTGIDFEGLEAFEPKLDRRFGAFDLEAYLTETSDDLTVDFQYATSLFDAATINRWLGYYLHLLRQMSASPDARIADLRLLDDAERRELTVSWDATSDSMPPESALQHFERQAAQHPERAAIQGSGGSLTYGELSAKANRLARYLRDLGVEAERLVGICVERSPDMVVALLAVHKAGGAFVPMDPGFPRERLEMVAEDAGLHAVVTRRELADGLRLGDAALVFIEETSALAGYDDADIGIAPSLSDLAYVIFTSGSTGRPKGVEIEQLALANLLSSMRDEPGLEADDVLLAVTTISFDISILEIFLPLVVGATIVLADASEAIDGIWLRDRLGAGDVTVMQATPATWQMLLDAGWSGSPGLKALCGGEALSRDLADELRPRVRSLWNVYGPTETTIWSSVGHVTGDDGPITIGAPIANTEFHVLDGSLQPQPPGIVGGLFIGGMGLARGYHGQPGLTEERFISVSFDGEPRRRLYRTGDLARRLADGRIEFLGRDDHQVKVRGFRIELGEIETVMARHPGVKDVVVVARPGTNGTKRLVAYVIPVADGGWSVSDARMHLRGSLPDYMVPSVFVELDVFPLTANLKVDRARLPDPDQQRPDLETELVEPRTEAEATLARIWERLLDLEQVGVEDNFFDLGGDSLLALRCVVQANRSGISLAPNSIFQYQTIAELARAAEEGAGSGVEDQAIVTGPMPLTPAQLRFLHERATPDVHHWNISTLVSAERLSPPALRAAVHALLRHHDALRLRLWQEDGQWRQEIAEPSEDTPFESHDVSMLAAQERVATIERICSRSKGSFVLGEGPLIRVIHFDCGPDAPDRLFVTIHHFAVDGLTWGVFWEDLAQAYRQAEAGLSISLPPKTTSIKAWATQLMRLAQTPRVVDTAAEWLRMPWQEVVKLPTDFVADHQSNTNASTTDVTLELSHDETRRLVGGRLRPEHVLVTALAACQSAWTGSRTVLIDVLSHGRDAAFEGVNLARTVGFTLSYNPLVLSHPTWEPTHDTLRAVVSQVEGGPEGFSFELLRFLAVDRDLRDTLTRLPRADVLFNYQGSVAPDHDDASWRKSTDPTGPDESPRGLRQYPIAVRAALAPNLQITFIYSTALHDVATIEARGADVLAAIRLMLEEAESPAAHEVA